MDGWPVWLASMSRRDRNGDIIPTGKWTPEQLAEGEDMLNTLLDGVGDDSRERCFRMCMTLCRHRALSQDEVDGLPEWWDSVVPTDIAGGPVQVLWMKGVEDRPSTRPCENPGRHVIDALKGLYLPLDCGECEPCLARIAVHA